MQYKTIVLELLQQHPEVRRLRGKQMLTTLDHHAGQLKARHEAWKDRLAEATPGGNPGQIASAALEIALKELEGSLSPELPADDSDPLTVEEAMAFIRGPGPAA